MPISNATDQSEEISEKFYNYFNEFLVPLLRDSTDPLNAYLEEIASNIGIQNTQTRAHCRYIALDGNRRPRARDFARFIAAKIVDFSIPRSEVQKALIKCNETGSTYPITTLARKAKKLFTRLPKSGEGGEVLLSILAETFLKLPQLFTKMILKTSSNMHVHGSDGIHIGVNQQNGNMALYWGESKLYSSVNDAVKACFSSLAPFLLDEGGSDSAQERDIQLMRDGINLNNQMLEIALKRFLDPDNHLFQKLEYRGLCLVGFDSDDYPNKPNSLEAYQLKEKIVNTFNRCKTQISKRVFREKIQSFEIEIFCIPFPSVEDFRSYFQAELGVKDDQR